MRDKISDLQTQPHFFLLGTGFSRSYEVLYASPKAQTMMQGQGGAVLLPVPQCVRAAEAAKEAKLKALQKELQIGLCNHLIYF